MDWLLPCDHELEMPEISRFFGIVIMMWFNDHSEPHFHARYGEHKAKVAIRSRLAR